MNPVRKQRLIVVLLIVIASSVIAGLLKYAVGSMGNLFFSVSQVVNGEAPLDKAIRAGGCVVPGTIEKAKDRLETQFLITDGVENLRVSYDGILPDLFGEGEAAVVKGKLNESGIIIASEVLAKHDESYTPKEVEDSVQNTSGNSMTCEGLDYDS